MRLTNLLCGLLKGMQSAVKKLVWCNYYFEKCDLLLSTNVVCASQHNYFHTAFSVFLPSNLAQGKYCNLIV